MIYARVHDQTVADDYYSAMQQVEKRLDLLSVQEGPIVPIVESEREQLLALTTQLEQPELNLKARLNIVAQIHKVLACPIIDQTTYSLSAPIFASRIKNCDPPPAPKR